MLEHDAHIYAYQWNIVCLYALNLSFLLYYHHVYKRGRSSETMIPVLCSHKKVSSYFYAVKPENHKNSGYSLCFILVL
jgi:hypothetical protein